MSNILKTNKLNSYPAISHCMSPYPLLLSITSPPPHYPPIVNLPLVKLMSRKPTAVLAAGEVYIGGEADQQQGGRRQQEVSHRSWPARPRYLVTFCTGATAEVAIPGILTLCTLSMLQKQEKTIGGYIVWHMMIIMLLTFVSEDFCTVIVDG